MMNPFVFSPLSAALEAIKSITALSIAVIGDVHLDHTKVPTHFIIDRLDVIFSEEYLSRLDVLVINGDLFERRVMFDSESAYQSVRWIIRLIRNCVRHNITLHVLEGTPSHDNTQARWFGELIEHLNVEIDFYYHNTLEITPLRKGSELTALWVPDEFSTSAAITQNHVKQLMVKEGRETVSYTFIHGMFVHQEPVQSKASHDEVFYESITDYLIVINHIHTPSSSGKIRAPGSVCRLRHGEEETKGHLYIQHDETITELFVETPNNARFDTVDMMGKDMVYVKNYLDKRLEAGGLQFIKLKLKRSDGVLVSVPDLRKRYPSLNITTKVIDDDVPETVTDALIDRPVLVSIRPETLPELLLGRMTGYDLNVQSAAKQLLVEKIP